MAFFQHHSPVMYVCTCGELKPLSRIYFCRYCSKIRCGFCVCHEVDARYCSNCMENLPVAEAWMKKNCCSYCFTCPVCHHSLTTRITTVQSKKDKSESSEKEEGKSDKPDAPKKYYYLNCFFCHWTNRDVGIPDQTTASSNWPETENPHTARVNNLIEYWKAVSLADRLIKEKKQPSTRRSYTHLSGMSAALARRKAGLPAYPSSPFGLSSLQDVRKPPQLDPPEALSEINDLPENIFTSTPDLNKITSLDQRLGTPELQAVNMSDLQLCRRLLLTKRSQRCRECEHNVTKPEYNPSSIKFKIQLSAYYHIPEIHIKTCEPLRAGKVSNLIINIINPTPYQTTIQLLPIENDEETSATGAASLGSGDGDGGDPASLISKKTPFIKIEPRPLSIEFTGLPELPKASIVLPGRDDAAEYDDNSENQNFNDDPKIVIWRRGNKAAVQFPLRPREDLELGTDVIIGFIMHHAYTNTIIQQKEQQKINHKVKIALTVGKTVGSG